MKIDSILISIICMLCCEIVKGFANIIIDEKPRNICGFQNGHRKYIELGESNTVQATNITFKKVCCGKLFLIT